MKCVCVQVWLAKNTSHNEQDLITLFKSVGRYPEIDFSEDGNRYVNLNFFTEDIVGFWKDVEKYILGDSNLGKWVRDVAVVACEGEQGWDDFLLLFHHDTSEKIDVL